MAPDGDGLLLRGSGCPGLWAETAPPQPVLEPGGVCLPSTPLPNDGRVGASCKLVLSFPAAQSLLLFPLPPSSVREGAVGIRSAAVVGRGPDPAHKQSDTEL